MKNLERKKFKRLGINYLYAVIFLSHLFILMIMGFVKSFANEKYPIYILLDNYFVVGIIFNPILIAAIVKRTIEIEEKNNMWQLQQSFGQNINEILIEKFKILSFRLFEVSILEWIVIIFIARRSAYFVLEREEILRILNLFISYLSINIFFVALFIIVEMKVNREYFTFFFSIAGAFTGIISMLLSKILCYINPFGYMASLINLSYRKESDVFIRVLEKEQHLTLIISVMALFLLIFVIKRMKKLKLYKN